MPNPPRWRTCSFWLATTASSVYSLLLCISRDHHLYPHPEDSPRCGVRGSTWDGCEYIDFLVNIIYILWVHFSLIVTSSGQLVQFITSVLRFGIALVGQHVITSWLLIRGFICDIALGWLQSKGDWFYLVHYSLFKIERSSVIYLTANTFVVCVLELSRVFLYVELMSKFCWCCQ